MPNAALNNLFISPPSLSQNGSAALLSLYSGSNFDDALQQAGQPPAGAPAESAEPIDDSGPTWADLNSSLQNQSSAALKPQYHRQPDTDRTDASSSNTSLKDQAWQLNSTSDDSPATQVDQVNSHAPSNRAPSKENSPRSRSEGDTPENSSNNATASGAAGQKPNSQPSPVDHHSSPDTTTLQENQGSDTTGKVTGQAPTTNDTTVAVNSAEGSAANLFAKTQGAISANSASQSSATNAPAATTTPATTTVAATEGVTVSGATKAAATAQVVDQTATPAAASAGKLSAEELASVASRQAANQTSGTNPLYNSLNQDTAAVAGTPTATGDTLISGQEQSGVPSAGAAQTVEGFAAELATSSGEKAKRESQTSANATAATPSNIDQAAIANPSIQIAPVGTVAAAPDKTTSTSSRSNDQSSQSIAAANKPASVAGNALPDTSNAAAANATGKLTAASPQTGTVNQNGAVNSEQRGAATQFDQVRFVQRVANAFKAADDQGGQIRLRLSPPELGALKVEISLRNGTLTAHVEAETNTARNMLLDNLPALRERLAGQNIKVERFDVDLKQDGAGNGSANAPPDFSGARQNSPRSPQSGRLTGIVPTDSGLTTPSDGITGATSNGQINIVV